MRNPLQLRSTFPPSAKVATQRHIKERGLLRWQRVHTLCQSTLVTPSESSRGNRVARVTHIWELSGCLILVNMTVNDCWVSVLKANKKQETQQSGAGDDAQTSFFLLLFFYKKPQLVDTQERKESETQAWPFHRAVKGTHFMKKWFPNYFKTWRCLGTKQKKIISYA